MTNIVLVHGLWSDGSSWAQVITELLSRGHEPVAAQLALESFDDDVASVRRTMATVAGPLLLVGWSYGGAVISAAAVGQPQVKALAYVAGFAPEEGESVSDLSRRRRGSLIREHLVITDDRHSYLDRAHFGEVMAHDAGPLAVAIAAATQRLPRIGVDAGPSGHPAWHELPTHYLLATEDRAVPPQTQREMAIRMGAAITEIDSSHAPMLSRPADVARFLDAIARTEAIAE